LLCRLSSFASDKGSLENVLLHHAWVKKKPVLTENYNNLLL
jgi:hypothetical protein